MKELIFQNKKRQKTYLQSGLSRKAASQKSGTKNMKRRIISEKDKKRLRDAVFMRFGLPVTFARSIWRPIWTRPRFLRTFRGPAKSRESEAERNCCREKQPEPDFGRIDWKKRAAVLPVFRKAVSPRRKSNWIFGQNSLRKNWSSCL